MTLTKEQWQKRLRNAYSYDPETGIVTYRHRPRLENEGLQDYNAWLTKYVGKQPGTMDACGYMQAKVLGRHTKLHHIAWFIYYGQFPSKQIDHINGDRLDNRIINLREVDGATNSKNRGLNKNRTGFPMGVYARPYGMWWSVICDKGKRMYLGTFDNLFDACCARKSAERRLGFHINHGDKYRASNDIRVWS